MRSTYERWPPGRRTRGCRFECLLFRLNIATPHSYYTLTQKRSGLSESSTPGFSRALRMACLRLCAVLLGSGGSSSRFGGGFGLRMGDDAGADTDGRARKSSASEPCHSSTERPPVNFRAIFFAAFSPQIFRLLQPLDHATCAAASKDG